MRYSTSLSIQVQPASLFNLGCTGNYPLHIFHTPRCLGTPKSLIQAFRLPRLDQKRQIYACLGGPIPPFILKLVGLVCVKAALKLGNRIPFLGLCLPKASARNPRDPQNYHLGSGCLLTQHKISSRFC